MNRATCSEDPGWDNRLSRLSSVSEKTAKTAGTERMDGEEMHVFAGGGRGAIASTSRKPDLSFFYFGVQSFIIYI